MKEQLQKDFNNSIKNLSLSQKDIEIKKFCLDNFIDKGFPNKKEEDWKFSDLNQIIKNNIGELSFYNDQTSTNKVDTSVFVDGLEHNKIVFINGRIEKIDFQGFGGPWRPRGGPGTSQDGPRGFPKFFKKM